VFSQDGSLLTAILRKRRNKSRLKKAGKQLLPANQFSQTPAFFLLNFSQRQTSNLPVSHRPSV
jgi:hypothetical protein